MDATDLGSRCRKVIAFLEDRRVLYVAYDMESIEHVIQSVLQIRELLTEVIGKGGIAEGLSGPIRAMRNACQKLLTDVGTKREGPRLIVPTAPFGGPLQSDPVFNQKLGEMRSTFGLNVAIIAVRFGIDIEDGLASALPGPEDDTRDMPTKVELKKSKTIYLNPPENS